MQRLRVLSGVRDDGNDREKPLREFCVRFAERAFRRPLTDEQKAVYIDRQFAEAKDLNSAVKRVVLLVLSSPRFLYREIGGEPLDPYNIASRISFGLWDSPPDRERPAEAVARDGRLSNDQSRGRSARPNRMVDDPRTRAKLPRVLPPVWLRVEQVPDLSKDPRSSLYPGFDASVASDLRTSLDLFLDDVIWGESSDFRQLFLADSIYLNGRLATLYGADLPPDSPFKRVALDPKERAGLLTHPYLLANFAYTSTSSPIHRGVFKSAEACWDEQGPGRRPIAVAPLAPDLHAGLTTRERVTLQTSPASCITCHGMINPLGFSLERFDAIGRFRTDEKGKPIDASGMYDPPSGEITRYNGARQLAETLAASEEAHTAFVEQLFHHIDPAADPGLRPRGPRPSFAARSPSHNCFNIRSLLVEGIVNPPHRRPITVARSRTLANPPTSPGWLPFTPRGGPACRIQRPDATSSATWASARADLPFFLNLPSLGFANQERLARSGW